MSYLHSVPTTAMRLSGDLTDIIIRGLDDVADPFPPGTRSSLYHRQILFPGMSWMFPNQIITKVWLSKSSQAKSSRQFFSC